MSSYSGRDIHEAFECAKGILTVTDSSFDSTRMAVFSHLEGTCDCNLRRCHHCRARPHNGFLTHAEGCPMGM